MSLQHCAGRTTVVFRRPGRPHGFGPRGPVFVLLLSLFFTAAPCPADDLVRVFFHGSTDVLRSVLSTGFRTVLHRRGKFIDVVLPHGRVDEFRRKYECRVLQRGMDVFVRGLSRRPDRGVYHSFPELERHLDDWESRQPLKVRVETIGYGWDTRRGLAHRPISMATIGLPEPGKPGVLLFGGIHAREIATTETVLSLVDRLLRLAGTDEHVAGLLDRVVLYVIPCLNPDGRERVFEGHIWWRKNCRPGHGGKVLGVDLNRNFPFHFGPNQPAGGSSHDPASETYRGPAALSEPESRALQRLVRRHPDIVASLAFHGYGRFLIVPFGYNGRWPAEHETLYRRVAAEISRETDWAVGTVSELLGYFSNGRHDDWLYGSIDGGKERILAFQAEIGDTFFPFGESLPSLADEAARVVLHLLERVQAYPVITLRIAGVSPSGAFSTVALELANKRPGRLRDISVSVQSPRGKRYALCTGEELSGLLRGHGPRKLRRLFDIPGPDALGEYAVLVSWRGGSLVKKLHLSPGRSTVLED